MSTTSIPFYWNGVKVSARAGDTVAAALWRAGITTLARSRKRHRPLGLSGATLAGVLGRVGEGSDGTPNVRLDLQPVRAGLRVAMQNTWPHPRFDVLRLVQYLPGRALYGGFEHGRWLPRSGLAYRVAERLMAQLAGVARPGASGITPHGVPGQRLALDCLVVGGGPAGIAAANQRAALGQNVALVSRGATPARFARAMGVAPPELDDRVQWLGGMELCGVYRQGRLLLAAPHDAGRGAILFAPQQVVLATGRRSMPPLVPGNDLPGVLDAHAALALAFEYGVVPGQRIAVVGTGGERAVSVRLQTKLRELGCAVVHIGPVAALTNIKGQRRVRGVCIGTEVKHDIACDALIHAGPWRADPGLAFQASAEGPFQLLGAPLPAHISLVGACALADEAIALPDPVHPDALVCSCMDVSAGELLAHIQRGETDPEVSKRLTGCGMGACQGLPCWELMLALLAANRDGHGQPARPSHRPPRRAITVAQAAGLDGLVAPQQ